VTTRHVLLFAFDPRLVGPLPPRRIQGPDGNAVDAFLAKKDFFLIQSPGDNASSNWRQFPFGQSSINHLLGQEHFIPIDHHAKSYVQTDMDVTVDQHLAQEIYKTLDHDPVARPETCKGYPYTDKKDFVFSTTTRANDALVCPAAFAIVEKMKKRLR
jgi:hypothetical protein